MVKFPTPPESILTFLRGHTFFCIAGHREPDGDCVGSQLALASLLQRMGKKTIVCSSGPFKRHELQPYKKHFITDETILRAALEQEHNAGGIIVDCSGPERLGTIAPAFAGLPYIVIDHHATSDAAGDACYVHSEAPACVLLVFYVATALGLPLTPDETDLLFMGLCTDTGFFRHLDTAGADTLEVAAALVRRGANPKQTFHLINGGKTLASRVLLGTVLARAESYIDGRLVISYETHEDTDRYGLENRDSDMLYQLLLSTEGVEAVAIIREEPTGDCALGLRSVDRVNVAAVAAALGGGGHKNAAGALIHASIPEARALLLARFEDAFARLAPT